MLKRFFPREFYNSVFEIDYGLLMKKGFCGLVFDIDNTLAAFDIAEPPDNVLELFENLKAMGFKLCLLSNNSEQRVVGFNRKLNLHAIHKAGKPKRRGIYRALELIGLKKEQVVLIGDQMFTDVWGGNRSGVYTILVNPLASRDEWTVKLKRKPEKIVKSIFLKKYNKDKE